MGVCPTMIIIPLAREGTLLILSERAYLTWPLRFHFLLQRSSRKISILTLSVFIYDVRLNLNSALIKSPDPQKMIQPNMKTVWVNIIVLKNDFLISGYSNPRTLSSDNQINALFKKGLIWEEKIKCFRYCFTWI